MTGKYSKDTVAVGAIVTVIVSSTALATAYTVSTNRDLREQIALAEKEIAAIKMEAKKDIAAIKLKAQNDIAAIKLEAQTDIAIAKPEAKKDIEAIKLETKRRVAEAKRETAERLLLFGYRAEFLEFQKQFKLGDHAGKEETSAKK